jgi:hypothetical protein
MPRRQRNEMLVFRCHVDEIRQPRRSHARRQRDQRTGANAAGKGGLERAQLLRFILGLRHDALQRTRHAEVKDIFRQIHRRPQHCVQAISGEAEHRHIERLCHHLD